MKEWSTEPIGDKKINEWIELRKKKWTYQQIGEKYGMTRQNIHLHLKNKEKLISRKPIKPFVWICEFCRHSNERKYNVITYKQRFMDEICSNCGKKRYVLTRDNYAWSNELNNPQ